MPKITEQELQQIRRFLEKKRQRREENRRKLYRAARADFQKIIDMIIRKYQPKRIYHWGSLLNERHFTELSDIDIALEGITAPEDFFALLGDAEELTSFPLHIVQLEKIHPLHAQSIKKRGKLIYESKCQNVS